MEVDTHICQSVSTWRNHDRPIHSLASFPTFPKAVVGSIEGRLPDNNNDTQVASKTAERTYIARLGVQRKR